MGRERRHTRGVNRQRRRPTDPSTRDLIFETEGILGYLDDATRGRLKEAFMAIRSSYAEVCHDIADSGPVVSRYEMQTYRLLADTDL